MATSRKIILGIDPGTRITGYGLITNTFNPIDFGCIRPPVDAELPQRYHILFKGILQLIKLHSPDAVAVETQFLNKNVQSTMKIAMARAAVLIAASEHQIPIFEYTPKKAKLAVVGNGQASKEQVQKMVQLLLKLPFPPEPEDASDALSLAICHAHTLTSYK
jgi:crossover junction endodeoxyribonuclease RuvC